MTLEENKFNALADETLNHLLEAIDDELGDRLDVDMENGMLTIVIEPGGQYIINKHGPNRQIWLSSPVSGASHFEFNEGLQAWINTRGDENLKIKLAGELSSLTGTSFGLD